MPVRICVITELIAPWMPMCVSRIAFPGLTPSLKKPWEHLDAVRICLWGQSIILKLMAFPDQSPFANWVTIQEYREGLLTAGYARESIETRDISENVFGQLAGCLKKTELEVE